MIIPKADQLTDEQLAEVEGIVGDFHCRIEVIHGAHRKIYAIIGDERSENHGGIVSKGWAISIA